MIARTLALPLLMLLMAPCARAETTLCQEIASIPTVIATQGVYCLKHNLSTAITSNPAIRIDTNNVTIDCNGHKLGGLAAGNNSMAYGIAAVDRRNITIRNCSVRGFYRGIELVGDESGYHVIEDNALDNNLYQAINVTGDGSTIRRNQVRDTGGSTVSTQAHGISVSGSAVEVLDNMVDGVVATDNNAVGVLAIVTDGLVVRGNRIRNLSSGSAEPTFAINLSLSASAVVIGNTAWASGAMNAYGIDCGGATSAARGNTVLDYNDVNGIYACTELDNHSN